MGVAWLLDLGYDGLDLIANVTMRIFEIGCVVVGILAIVDGAQLALTGVWRRPWQWMVKTRPGASARLYGTGLISFGIALSIAPVLWENRAAIPSPYIAIGPQILALLGLVCFVGAFSRKPHPPPQRPD